MQRCGDINFLLRFNVYIAKWPVPKVASPKDSPSFAARISAAARRKFRSAIKRSCSSCCSFLASSSSSSRLCPRRSPLSDSRLMVADPASSFLPTALLTASTLQNPLLCVRMQCGRRLRRASGLVRPVILVQDTRPNVEKPARSSR